MLRGRALTRGVAGYIFTRLLVEHGINHSLHLVDRPYLHAQALGLVQDITTVRLFKGSIEHRLLVFKLSGVDGSFVGGGAAVNVDGNRARSDDMGDFSREEFNLALYSINNGNVIVGGVRVPSRECGLCS